MPKILIATPTNRDEVALHYAFALAKMMARLARNGIETDAVSIVGSSLADQRDTLANAFLQENKWTHTLLIDSDMNFPIELCERFLAHDKELIGVLAPKRTIDFKRMHDAINTGLSYEHAFALAHDLVWLPISVPPETRNGLMLVRAVGMGFTLIRRDCFERMLSFGNVPKLTTHSGGSIWGFFQKTDNSAGQIQTEDVSFCTRFREAGGDVFVDPSVTIGHVGTQEFRMSFANWIAARTAASKVQQTLGSTNTLPLVISQGDTQQSPNQAHVLMVSVTQTEPP